MNGSTLRWAVVVLGLFAAVVHLLLNIPFKGENAIFTVNGLGYLALAAAFFFAPSLPGWMGKPLRYAFMGYATVTILGWVFLSESYSILGYVTKADEVLLILALWRYSGKAQGLRQPQPAA